jgi:hypothetical protein
MAIPGNIDMETKKIRYLGRSVKFSESALADFRECIQSLPFAKKAFGDSISLELSVEETRLFLKWLDSGRELRYPE